MRMDWIGWIETCSKNPSSRWPQTSYLRRFAHVRLSVCGASGCPKSIRWDNRCGMAWFRLNKDLRDWSITILKKWYNVIYIVDITDGANVFMGGDRDSVSGVWVALQIGGVVGRRQKLNVKTGLNGWYWGRPMMMMIQCKIKAEKYHIHIQARSSYVTHTCDTQIFSSVK